MSLQQAETLTEKLVRLVHRAMAWLSMVPMSLPSTPGQLKPLVQRRRVEDSTAFWKQGKEKVKPIGSSLAVMFLIFIKSAMGKGVRKILVK